MQVSALLIPSVPWAELARDLRVVDESPCATAYFADHLTHPTMAGEWLADAWTTLAAAAMVTSRVGLGTLVASAAIRNPTSLARAAASLQDLSEGRFVLGVGSGVPGDALADGREPGGPVEAGARFRDVARIVRAVWAGEREFTGETIRVTGLETAGLPPGRPAPNLVLAAHGRAGMELAAGIADGWTTFGGSGIRGASRDQFWETVHHQASRFDAACAAAGRQPGSARRSVLVGYADYLATENLEMVLAEVERAESAGFDEIVFYWPTGASGGRFAGDEQALLTAMERVDANPRTASR